MRCMGDRAGACGTLFLMNRPGMLQECAGDLMACQSLPSCVPAGFHLVLSRSALM
jgi:hypothetical protein